MPVPIPRQRAIPAAENGQAPTPAVPGGTSTGTPGPSGPGGESAPRKQATTGMDAADSVANANAAPPARPQAHI